uniref:Uncharacterized protein n=1 Tax=Plectus sambesii TaxID=2011161 RepID=A0A914X2Y7_9BILA
MVHKQSTISALYTDDGSHGRRPSDSGTLSRASSGRMSRRFSEMLKKRFGRRTSKTPVTQPTLSSQLSENGDLPPSRTFSIPTATKAHFYSDRTSTSSATTDLNDVLSAVHEDDQSDDVFPSDILEVVPEVEEVDESNPPSTSRHPSGENKE